MRYNKVLLVHFYYPESGYGERLEYPPIGLGYLSEYLEQHNINTNVLDMGNGKSMQDAEDYIKQHITAFNPNLIAIGLNSICFNRSIEIINNIHKLFPNIHIVVGGPHASTKGVELLNKYNSLTYVIVREGEQTLVQLCLGEEFKNINGLCWRNGEVNVQNKDLPSKDLSGYNFPKYKKFELNLYGNPNTIGILTSRGCPYKCIFCQQSSLLGKQWRGRTPEDIVEEIKYWKQQGKNTIHIIDDNFSFNTERILKLSKLIIQEHLDDMNYILVGGLRVDKANKHVLTALKLMGVKLIPFGIESGSERILKAIKKGITVGQANKTIKLACDMGFNVKLFFILGFPTETIEDVNKTFNLALKYPITNVRFFNLIPYEDTELIELLKEYNTKFYYTYDEYMNNFKRFQRIPIFECNRGLSTFQQEEVLNTADEITKVIEGYKL